MQKNTKTLLYCVFFLLTGWVSGCKTMDLYEKHIPIPAHEWKRETLLKGSFTISDTTAEYQLFLVLRHTDAYAYNNIWLNMGLQSPGDTMFIQKLNLALGDDAQGWFGTGMNDIWEVRKPLTDRPRKFVKPGTYNYSIAQIMRDNPLKQVMSAGIRVEKIGK
jgi:gliding motility-associated lipoprotein GldH